MEFLTKWLKIGRGIFKNFLCSAISVALAMSMLPVRVCASEESVTKDIINDMTIKAGEKYVIKGDVNLNAELSIEDGGTLYVGDPSTVGTLTLGENAEITNAGTLDVHTLGEIKNEKKLGFYVNVNSGNIDYVASSGTVETNSESGTIGINSGTVSTNEGAVTTNNSSGMVEINSGIVRTNDWKVDTNNGKVSTNNGEVSTNNGEVSTNNGTVITSNSSGTVTTNNGTVNINHGRVETNSESGTIGINSGTVTTNNSTVESNGGTVTTNNGTVKESYQVVGRNFGTVETNIGIIGNFTGKVENNLIGGINVQYLQPSADGASTNLAGKVLEKVKGKGYIELKVTEGADNLDNDKYAVTYEEKQSGIGVGVRDLEPKKTYIVTVTVSNKSLANDFETNEITVEKDQLTIAVDNQTENYEHTYDGNEWKPVISVEYDGKKLEENKDYTINLPNDMTSAGKKAITITFQNGYKGEVELEGKISPKEPEEVTIKIDGNENSNEHTYDGKAPKIDIIYGGISLVEGTDYDLDKNGADLSKVGEHEIKIKFKGNYSGEKTFKVIVKVNTDKWGTAVNNDGILNYVDSEGKTSAEVKGKSIVWLKEESGGTSAWYGIDNSEGAFARGSRFWVKWLNSTENTEEFYNYYNQLDDEHKRAVERNNMWIFLIGVTHPDGNEYGSLSDEVTLYIELGEDWDKDDLVGLFISGGEDEKLSITYMDVDTPAGKKTVAKVTIKHFSPYAIYDEFTAEERAALERLNAQKSEGTQNDVSAKGLLSTGECRVQVMLLSISLVLSLAGYLMLCKKKQKYY